jgi:hypothetical protein
MLIALLPPGAFFGLCLNLAIKNRIDQRIDKRHRAASAIGNKHLTGH